VKELAKGAAQELRETRFKDYPLELKPGERLSIVGIKSTVRILGQPSAKSLVLRVRKTIAEKVARENREELNKFEQLTFNVRRVGSNVVIESKGPDSKSGPLQWAKPESPELVMDIEGFAVPVEIGAKSGAVTVSNWSQPLSIVLVNGTVKSSVTEGRLRIQNQTGVISVDRHQGGLEVDSFAGKLAAQDVNGDVDVSDFSGDSSILRMKGNLDWRSHSGALSLNQSSGSLDFINGRGVVQVAAFEGAVRGQTELGSVTVAVQGLSDVRIESNQGAVSVKLPADSGASLRLRAEDGFVSVPASLRDAVSGGGRQASGQLPGVGPRGSVDLKSKSGALRIM
jgi:hypothetical protein